MEPALKMDQVEGNGEDSLPVNESNGNDESHPEVRGGSQPLSSSPMARSETGTDCGDEKQQQQQQQQQQQPTQVAAAAIHTNPVTSFQEEEKATSSSHLVVSTTDEPTGIVHVTMHTTITPDTTTSSNSNSNPSSVRLSLAADSNYSANSSNRSLGGYRSGGSRGSATGRSLDLRKTPMDTSLLFGSSQLASPSKNGNGNGDNSSTFLTASPGPAAADGRDNSDNTHTEEEDYDDADGSGGKRGGLFREGSLKKSRRQVHGSWPTRFLRSTCLRSNFSLQSQLLLSFGMVSLLIILLVMSICVAVSIVSGKNVNDLTSDSLMHVSHEMEGNIVRYVAEALSTRLLPDDLVQILHDATVDRFIGYPDFPGYENDTLTPFRDVYTQNRIYPVKGPPSPWDWDLKYVVTEENALEHLQHRHRWFENYEKVTTSTAAYTFPGVCNPQAKEGDFDHYPNCTDANNDVTTGVVVPTTTNEGIWTRSSDLTPLFKAIFEATPNLRDVGICFANDGAGSSAIFPGYTIDSNLNYISAGCEWMRQPNPYKPDQPIGTEEQIAKCHPKGTVVHNREFNGLERPWCIKQALKPDMIHMNGPFIDAWNNAVQIMLVGKAIYDPLTKEFTGCMFMDFTLDGVQGMLERIKVTRNSHVSLARWNDRGIVASSSALNSDNVRNNEETKLQDLGVGIQAEVYQRLFSMVDYSAIWDPNDVREIYAKAIHHDREEGYMVAAYPMPPVPAEYDPDYRPDWLVIMSVATEDVLDQSSALADFVDEKVESLVYFSLVAGIVGWALVMIVVMVVSQALTLPLKSMNQATKDIVDNFGGSSEKGIAYNSPSNPVLTKCAPETEISQVVSEFKKMVQKFSGKSKMAKAVQERFTELENHFSFEYEFEELYQSRQEGSFAYAYDKSDTTPPPSDLRAKKKFSSSATRRNGKGSHLTHFGTILTGSQSHLMRRKSSSKLQNQNNSKGKRLTSPLFLWIVVFIVTPLLITTVTMSAIVTYNVSRELTEVIDDGKAEYVKLEKFALTSAVVLRANWIAGTAEKSTRDLHILSRYASWLLFGGLERRESFTELTTGAEECKTERNPDECDYVEEMPCDCIEDPTHESCLEFYEEMGPYASRYLQEAYFFCQSHDAMANGDRKEALSFPDFAFSPQTTAWYKNMTSVPGFEIGPAAEGYGTTYDRLRVLSAIPIFQTLYNYNVNNGTVLQSAVAMEADGMVVGYHGCSMMGEAMAAFWESTPSNEANEIRPELCPVGKYGFDPRCRDWYNTSKQLGEKRESDLHISAPYLFATDGITGQTCTSPLVDPHTGEHVAQTFVDFRSDSIYDILSPYNTVLKGGFPILVAARADRNKADTIIGPGYKLGDEPQPIEHVVLGNGFDCSDPKCMSQNQEIQQLFKDMKSGQVGNNVYSVRSDDGTEEQIFVAYAPVNVTIYPSIDSSDFNKGVSVQQNTIYYIALTEKEATLVAAFDQVEEDINLTIDIGIAILSTAIIVATAVVIYISYWVAISITQPMLYLLELIRQINELGEDDDVLVDLDMQAGSREVKSVANTMGTLHKVVHCANSAYFAGDIDKAYAVLRDSARLFKRLDNTKAVGVANNNLGNTTLAMYRALKDNGGERFCGLTRKEIVLKGLSYFHKAIQLGEKAYDEFYEAEGWSPSCLDFMQHLSNRYFNRAMFLLSVKDDHDNPNELEELGMRDLQIARDMDVEIVDQGTEVGWQVNTADKLFKVSLNRARGHLLLLEMGYLDDWDLEELLEELFKSFKKEWKSNRHSSDLFQELGPAGRMQQVETELMRYKVLKGDMKTASQIAIRMLMEDEYILPEAQLKAVQILITVMKESKNKTHALVQLEQYESWLRRATAACDNNMSSSESAPTEDVSEAVMMSVAKMNMSLTMDDTSVRISRFSSLLATTRGDVTMEMF